MTEAVPAREKQADKLVRFLDQARSINALPGVAVETVFRNEAAMRSFLSEVSVEDFVEMLNGLNGIIRGKPKEEWAMDGRDVEISHALAPTEYTPPRPADKQELFEELLMNAKEMGAESRSREDIALMLAATINAVHAYADGNGRTSRTVYLLAKDGYSEAEKPLLKSALSDDGRFEFDINPGLIRTELEEHLLYVSFRNPEKNPLAITNLFREVPSTELVFKEDAPNDLRDQFLALSNSDGTYLKVALLEYLYAQENPEQYVKHFPAQMSDAEAGTPEADLLAHGRSALILNRLTPKLGEEELRQIINRYWQLKRQYVEELMDCIAHPDKEEYRVDQDGEKIRLIDLFKLEIKKQKEQNSKG